MHIIQHPCTAAFLLLRGARSRWPEASSSAQLNLFLHQKQCQHPQALAEHPACMLDTWYLVGGCVVCAPLHKLPPLTKGTCRGDSRAPLRGCIKPAVLSLSGRMTFHCIFPVLPVIYASNPRSAPCKTGCSYEDLAFHCFRDCRGVGHCTCTVLAARGTRRSERGLPPWGPAGGTTLS